MTELERAKAYLAQQVKRRRYLLARARELAGDEQARAQLAGQWSPRLATPLADRYTRVGD